MNLFAGSKRLRRCECGSYCRASRCNACRREAFEHARSVARLETTWIGSLALAGVAAGIALHASPTATAVIAIATAGLRYALRPLPGGTPMLLLLPLPFLFVMLAIRLGIAAAIALIAPFFVLTVCSAEVLRTWVITRAAQRAAGASTLDQARAIARAAAAATA